MRYWDSGTLSNPVWAYTAAERAEEESWKGCTRPLRAARLRFSGREVGEEQQLGEVGEGDRKSEGLGDLHCKGATSRIPGQRWPTTRRQPY